MKHSYVIEKIYEEEGLSFWTRLEIAFHILWCKRCARDIVRYEDACEIMRSDFFMEPDAHFADRVMAIIAQESAESTAQEFERGAEDELLPSVLPIRNWIVTGIIIITALTASFFGLDFIRLPADMRNIFVIPLAITAGFVILAYIIVFTVRCLPELSAFFGLKDAE